MFTTKRDKQKKRCAVKMSQKFLHQPESLLYYYCCYFSTIVYKYGIGTNFDMYIPIYSMSPGDGPSSIQ